VRTIDKMNKVMSNFLMTIKISFNQIR